MITTPHNYTVDLDSGTTETRWDTPLTYGDKEADKIQVTLMRGGVAATLSGLSSLLYGVRTDGETAFKAGTVVGNVVTVTMDSPFYAIPGRIELLLQLSEGTTVVNTPLRITAHVKSGQTDVMVSTGVEFSLAELQAIVAACQTATTNAVSATTAANTAAGNAQDAADAITGITAEAEAVAYGNPPTATVEEDTGDGHLNLVLGLPTGATGVRGSATYSGTAITGISTTPTAYATGIAAAIVGDLYQYNGTDTYNAGNEYKCTLGGNAATALWVYNRNNGGVPVGTSEPTGDQKMWVDTSDEPPESYDMTADMVAADGGGSVQDALDTHTSQLAEIQNEVDVLVVSGDSSVEAAQARVPSIGEPFVTLKARLDNSDSQLAAIATNEQSNGNFANTTGWTPINATLAAASNVLTATGNGGADSVGFNSATKTLADGDQEFIKVFKVRVTEAGATMIKLRSYGGFKDSIVANPVVGEWYELRHIVTGNATTAGTAMAPMAITAIYADAATANGKHLEAQEVMRVDLTGNAAISSYSVEELNDIFDTWFDGEGSFQRSEVTKKRVDLTNNALKDVEFPKLPTDLDSQILWGSESTLMHDFQTNVTQVAGTLTYDTDVKFSGTRSAKITSDASTGLGTARVDTGAGLTDISAKNLMLMMCVDGAGANVDYIRLQFWGEGFTNLGYWQTKLYGARMDKWDVITFSPSTTSAAPSNVRYIDVTIHRSASGQATVYFNQLRSFDKPTNGYVIITLDGAYIEEYTIIKPLLDAHGFKACVMVSNPEFIDLKYAGYMSIEQLRECEAMGWDICTHSGTRVDLLDETELRELAYQKKKWLRDNRFNLNRGGRFWCSLQNIWNQTAMDVLGEHFHFLRTGMYAGQLDHFPTLPIFNRHGIADFTGYPYANGVAHLDVVAAHKQWATLIWHQPGREGELTLEEMTNMLNYIEGLGLKVVTYSDVADKILGLK